MRAQIRYTYQDYLSIPEDTSRRHEIVDGDLFVTAAPRFRHQEVVANVLRVLDARAVAHNLGKAVAGPIGVHLHDEAVVEPDVIFVASERLAIVDPEGGVHGAPDLVVEVLSPTNRDYDRTLKRKLYMASSVPELWLLDADERTVEVWRPLSRVPEVARDTLTWRVGAHRFEIAVEELFRG